MTHRVLAALVVAPLLCGAQSTPTTLLPEQQAQHALSRLAFGPRPGDVAKVRAMGVEKWIDEQLHPEKIADAAGADAVKRYRSLGASTEEIATAARDAQRRRREEQRRMAADSMNGRPPEPAGNAQGRELQNRVLPE